MFKFASVPSKFRHSLKIYDTPIWLELDTSVPMISRAKKSFHSVIRDSAALKHQKVILEKGQMGVYNVSSQRALICLLGKSPGQGSAKTNGWLRVVQGSNVPRISGGLKPLDSERLPPDFEFNSELCCDLMLQPADSKSQRDFHQENPTRTCLTLRHLATMIT